MNELRKPCRLFPGHCVWGVNFEPFSLLRVPSGALQALRYCEQAVPPIWKKLHVYGQQGFTNFFELSSQKNASAFRNVIQQQDRQAIADHQQNFLNVDSFLWWMKYDWAIESWGKSRMQS